MKSTEAILLELMQELDSRPSAAVESIGKRVLVLSTPRCGSSMFCDVLGNTGRIGECREWFNMRYLGAYGRMKGLQQVNLGEYLSFIMEKATGHTGVFAVNAHIEQLVHLRKKNFDVMQLGFDHLVYLYRKDRIAQAVSLARAQITDSWSNDAREKQNAEGKITRLAITEALRHVVHSEHLYRDQWASRVHAEYAYEDFSRLGDTKAYDQILRALGIEPVAELSTDRKRQSRDDSGRIIEDYRRYLLGDHPGPSR